MNTPWGPSQQANQIMRGIWEVGTAGHGGIMVSRGVARALLSEAAVAVGMKLQCGNYLCYEEDCDWAVVVYELFEMFAANPRHNWKERSPEELKQIAFETLQSWHKNYLEQRGIIVPEKG